MHRIVFENISRTFHDTVVLRLDNEFWSFCHYFLRLATKEVINHRLLLCITDRKIQHQTRTLTNAGRYTCSVFVDFLEIIKWPVLLPLLPSRVHHFISMFANFTWKLAKPMNYLCFTVLVLTSGKCVSNKIWLCVVCPILVLISSTVWEWKPKHMPFICIL